MWSTEDERLHFSRKFRDLNPLKLLGEYAIAAASLAWNDEHHRTNPSHD